MCSQLNNSILLKNSLSLNI